MRRAHCVAWQAVHGEVPGGNVLDHTCRNPACVNPAHIEAVTQLINVRRGERPVLNASIVAKIKYLRASTTLTNRAIGEIVGASKSQVFDVVSGRCWRDVEPEKAA